MIHRRFDAVGIVEEEGFAEFKLHAVPFPLAGEQVLRTPVAHVLILGQPAGVADKLP